MQVAADVAAGGRQQQQQQQQSMQRYQNRPPSQVRFEYSDVWTYHSIPSVRFGLGSNLGQGPESRSMPNIHLQS